MTARNVEEFARRVLAMPEQVAIGFLTAYHHDTCKCGGEHDMAPLLQSMREHWAGRL